jgi:hypothetical protein
VCVGVCVCGCVCGVCVCVCVRACVCVIMYIYIGQGDRHTVGARRDRDHSARKSHCASYCGINFQKYSL